MREWNKVARDLRDAAKRVDFYIEMGLVDVIEAQALDELDKACVDFLRCCRNLPLSKRGEIKAEERRVDYLHGYKSGLEAACFIAPCSREAFDIEIHIKEKQLQEAVLRLREMLQAETRRPRNDEA